MRRRICEGVERRGEMRIPDWIRVSQLITCSQLSRSDELLCGIGCANLVLAFYAFIVHFERESDGAFALLFLVFGSLWGASVCADSACSYFLEGGLVLELG